MLSVVSSSSLRHNESIFREIKMYEKESPSSHKKSLQNTKKVSISGMRLLESSCVPIWAENSFDNFVLSISSVKKKREEAELSEFRSVDVLFRRILAESQPTNIFIGSPEKGGRFEIYARHISKIAGDVHRKLSKPVQDVSAASIALNLKTYSPISTDFEV